mmetsp:Transcript_8612/g.16229  ORF Transcript_8612/g.16229 Transcript_8612/m.16229 type:complete len:267 (+) Transcript_8612:145-945(+)
MQWNQACFHTFKAFLLHPRITMCATEGAKWIASVKNQATTPSEPSSAARSINLWRQMNIRTLYLIQVQLNGKQHLRHWRRRTRRHLANDVVAAVLLVVLPVLAYPRMMLVRSRHCVGSGGALLRLSPHAGLLFLRKCVMSDPHLSLLDVYLHRHQVALAPLPFGQHVQDAHPLLHVTSDLLHLLKGGYVILPLATRLRARYLFSWPEHVVRVGVCHWRGHLILPHQRLLAPLALGHPVLVHRCDHSLTDGTGVKAIHGCVAREPRG